MIFVLVLALLLLFIWLIRRGRRGSDDAWSNQSGTALPTSGDTMVDMKAMDINRTGAGARPIPQSQPSYPNAADDRTEVLDSALLGGLSQTLQASVKVLRATNPAMVNQTLSLKPVFTIGRANADLTLTGDKSVSREHAEIRYSSNQYTLTDLGSSNGTLINGERLAANQSTALRDGAVITIGVNTELRFQMDDMTQIY